MPPTHTPSSTAPSTRRARRARSRRLGVLVTAGIALGASAGVAGVAGAATAAMPATSALVLMTSAPGQLVDAALTAVTGDSAPVAIDQVVASAISTREVARSALVAAAAMESDVDSAGLPVSGPTEISTSALRAAIVDLQDADVTPLLLLPERIEDAQTEAGAVHAATVALGDRLDAAKQKKAEEDAAAAAAAAAAEAQRQAEEAAAALAAGNTVEGAQAFARDVSASQYGWGEDQFSCLVNLWNRESNWNYQAYNADGGATGIPQSLPGDKMASAGADWQTNARTQIIWGLGYIAGSYGSPCAAWAHSNAVNWY